MIGLDEAGAAATQMVAGAHECGQYTWNEDSQAHEEEGRASDAVSYLVDEKDTPGEDCWIVSVIMDDGGIEFFMKNGGTISSAGLLFWSHCLRTARMFLLGHTSWSYNVRLSKCNIQSHIPYWLPIFIIFWGNFILF